MKNIKPILVTILFFCFFAFNTAVSQTPPDPPEAGDRKNNNQTGGTDAPIGGGLLILLGLGAAYGGKKVYSLYRKKLTE